MRCPTLAELPPPPAGETGWPWTVETPQLPPLRPDGSTWPRISIVTPSFNQGDFVEETIRSVLLQGYPDLEYAIIDGGSSDRTVDIIKRYEPWLTYWVSEPDSGQAHAINKGFSRLSGDYLNWINSDDSLFHGALRIIAEATALAGDADLISGVRIVKDPATGYQFAQNTWRTNWPYYLYGEPDFPQDATFFSKYLLEKVNGIDERFQYSMDVAFFYRSLAVARKIILCDSIISKMHVYPSQKTRRADERKVVENQIMARDYGSKLGIMGRFRRMRLLHHAVIHISPLIYRRQRHRFQKMEWDVSTASWRLNTV
jgi:glycosyltransferase involved in cell wall biosynthesis